MSYLATELFKFASIIALAVGALLPIVNPLAGAPIFLSMTAGLSHEQRLRMAKSVAINSFMLLLVPTLVGAYVLDFFGLSIPVVQVAGGIVVCSIAWSLLHSPNSPPAAERDTLEIATPEAFGLRAFYPMTMPLTVGPGSITVALTLGANPPPGFRALLMTSVAQTIGIFIIALGIYLCDRYAEPMLRKLGAIGTSVVMRLSAFILLCIGVQICWNGVHALVANSFVATAS